MEKNVIHRFSTLTLIAALLIPLSADASAECVRIKLNDARKGATAVFEGTVTTVEKGSFEGEFAATMQVRRVWKGSVPKVATVYFRRSLDSNLQVGTTTIIFAEPLTPKIRADFELPKDSPSREMWVPTCVGQAPADPKVAKELGRSYAPIDSVKKSKD